MKAMVHTKPYEFEMQEYDVPSISDSEVLLRVKAVGICGSDVHGMSGKTGRRQTPIVMGHEAAGIIVKKRRDVQGFDMDERVTFDSTVYCNNCTFCFTGRANLCDNRKVLGVSCDDRKLEMAKELGADFVINSGRQDPREVLLEETGRAELDVSMEAVGLDVSVNTALSVVRKGGTVVLIGNWAPEITLPLQVVVMREIDMLGSAASNRDFNASVDLIASGRVKVDSLISKIAPLEEGPKWFQTLHDGKESLFKVILEPRFPLPL